MSWIKRFASILSINIAVLLGLVAVIAVIPPLYVDISKLVKKSTKALKTDKRALLPNYSGESWSKKHFEEFSALSTEYYDFITWRRKAFTGETITIDDDGYRRHNTDDKHSFPNSRIWFFGGSTAWGTGSRDHETIPAQLETLSGKSVFNFGESGYVSHQSLNLLMKAYVRGEKPEAVIFYDGVNDIAHKCRVGQNYFSTMQEQKIKSKLSGSTYERFSDFAIIRALTPTLEILNSQISKKPKPSDEAGDGSTAGNSMYDCDSNTRKMHYIASALIQDWKIAKNLVEGQGGIFVPVLQPVAYLGNPDINHIPNLNKEADLKRQYIAVYAEIRRLANESKLKYIDLTQIFDGKELYYIDFCHVSPNGNRRVAEKLLAHIQHK